MLTVTSLSRQSWLIEANDTCILVNTGVQLNHDSLKSDVGDVATADRLIESLGLVEAVIVTGESPDQFDLATINGIDRSVPLFLSNTCSDSASAILVQLGFQVTNLISGLEVIKGSLTIVAMAPDHLKMYNEGRWDSVSVLIVDHGDHGAFVATSSLVASAGMLKEITDRFTGRYLLICTGFSVSWTAREYLGQRLFSQDLDNAEGVGETDPGSLLRTGHCIQHQESRRFTFTAMELVDVCLVPIRWAAADRDVHYKSISSVSSHADVPFEDKLESVSKSLDNLAQFMYAGPLFRRLCSLSAQECAGVRMTMALVLVTDREGNGVGFEYNVRACRFDPICYADSRYICGFQCHAEDFISVLAGDVACDAILNRYHEWTTRGLVPSPFRSVIQPFFHPLRQPNLTLRRYTRKLTALSSCDPVIGGRCSVSGKDVRRLS